MHVHREEAWITVHAEHVALVAPGVRDWGHERLRGRATPGASATLAGVGALRWLR